MQMTHTVPIPMPSLEEMSVAVVTTESRSAHQVVVKKAAFAIKATLVHSADYTMLLNLHCLPRRAQSWPLCAKMQLHRRVVAGGLAAATIAVLALATLAFAATNACTQTTASVMMVVAMARKVTVHGV